jgi:hypothetical protein
MWNQRRRSLVSRRLDPLRLSAASGCVWAIIGLAVAFVGNLPGSTLQDAALTVVGGVWAAPCIGLLMGVLSRGFSARPVILRAMLAGGSLYCAVLLFVVASGLVAALQHGRLPEDFWFNSVSAAWAGLMWTWFFVLVWPLSYANHVLVSRAWES